jgi:dienelactone hydrolase
MARATTSAYEQPMCRQRLKDITRCRRWAERTLMRVDRERVVLPLRCLGGRSGPLPSWVDERV